MTGAYIRVQRDGKWQNIEIEHLTRKEREEYFKTNDPVKWAHLLCEFIAAVTDPLMEEL